MGYEALKTIGRTCVLPSFFGARPYANDIHFWTRNRTVTRRAGRGSPKLGYEAFKTLGRTCALPGVFGARPYAHDIATQESDRGFFDTS